MTAPADDSSTEWWSEASRFPLLGNPFIVAVARAVVASEAEAADALQLARAGEPVPWLDQRVLVALTSANDEHFRFDLRELHDGQEPSIEKWPTAVAIGPLSATSSTRKLTVVVLLSTGDSQEAEVDFPTLNRRETLTTGTMLAFPAYLHAVAGPASATAWVTHAHGPAFR